MGEIIVNQAYLTLWTSMGVQIPKQHKLFCVSNRFAIIFVCRLVELRWIINFQLFSISIYVIVFSFFVFFLQHSTLNF